MEFYENTLYHIYNRGNNREQVFFYPDNYIYFLKKVRLHVAPYCDILAYSLMPNHFHFIVNADFRTIQTTNKAGQERNVLSEGIRNLLSSYTQAINKQQRKTGSLFQQNTKSKCLDDRDVNYALVAFHYVHQNAFKSGLVSRMEDWPYSSFQDYVGLRAGTLCNKQLAIKLLGLSEETFYNDSYAELDQALIAKLY